MNSVPGDQPAPLPPDQADRLAESLRAPGAFAVDAETGAALAPPEAAALGAAARRSLLAFAREQRGSGAALLDLRLDGDDQPATPTACRLLTLDGDRRAVIVIPIDGGAHARPQATAASAAHASLQADDQPPVRILWQSDSEGVVTHVGVQLRRILGEQAGAIAGRSWSDLIGDVLLDPTDALATALAQRRTANNIELLWSSDRLAEPVSLLWSGAPAFDSGRRFRGFRGFLLAPASLMPAAPQAEPVAPPAPAPVDSAEPVVAPPPPAAIGSPALVESPVADVPAVIPAMPHLSAAERSAFREIARALGVRGVDQAPVAAPAQVDQAPRRPDLRLVESSPARADEKAAQTEQLLEPEPATIEQPAAGESPTAIDEALAYEVVEPLEDATAASPAAADEAPESESAESAIADPSAEDDAGVDEPTSDAAVQDAAAVQEPERLAAVELGSDAEPQPLPPTIAVEPAPTLDAAAIEARVAAIAAAMVEPSAERAAPAVNDAAPAPTGAIAHADDIAAPIAEAPAQTANAAPQLDPLTLHAPTILDRIPVGVLVNRGQKILFVNRTLMDLLDHPSAASIEAHGGVAGLFKGRAPLSERDGPTGPVLLNSRGGESIAVDARLQGVEWDGAPATLVTFRRAIDVEISQKLKAAELDLRAREAELRETRAVLDTATDGVAVIDEDGRVMTLNRTAEALFGYDQNEVAGESITTLFAPESHALAADYFEGLKSGGVRSVLNDGRELIGRVRQGGRIPLFVTFGQISDKPTRKFCAVMRDLTPWKKTERDLIEARKQAEEASAQKSDFLAKISHEIRTPLNAIIGFAEVMMEERFGPVGNERYKDYLRDVHASGGHVISLVNDLLDLSKIEAGKLDLNFVSVNANEIIRGAVNLMQPQSQRARVVVRSALAGRLPAIVADERALKQIVINLLSNAVKFTDSGGQVIVSSTLTDLGEVAIRIRDTGIGMSEKELSEAMEPFRQLATSRRAGGTGLGLPLTRALVEANRAHLKMSSVKNEGTLVEVVFPPTRVLAE